MILDIRNIVNFSVRIIMAMIILTVTGCGSRNRASSIIREGNNVDFRHSSLLSIKESDGISEVEIRNPWDSTGILQRLLLVDRSVELPPVDDGVTVIRIPLSRSVIFSSVHASLASELGHPEAVAGICDKDYITDKVVRERLNNGVTVDCGSSMSPSSEVIISLQPDAILTSPYDNGADQTKFEKFGIPTILCADYMETSPLGRAEWIKLFGRLFGESDKADSIFNATEKSYNSLKSLAKSTKTRPSVIFDRVYGQTWDQPGGSSTLGILTEDAGGTTPFAGDKRSGRIPLSPEKVVYEAGDADLWLIRYANTPLSLSSLAKERPAYSRLRPFKQGNVYGCETISSNIFDDQAFHPQWILADLISVFHPEIDMPEPHKKYFHKLAP